MLLQAIVTLDWLQQDGNQLGPLPGAIQSGHLGDQHSDLRRYLLKGKQAVTPRVNGWQQQVCVTKLTDAQKLSKKGTNEMW